MQLLKASFVLVTCFAAGLVTSGVVAGAGPLAALSSTTDTTATTETDTTTGQTDTTGDEPSEPPPTEADTTEADTTETETTDTESTETETTETEPPPSSGTPSIAADKEDYVPEEYVNLIGAGWQPGESVHLFVNDDEGQSWSHTANVPADEAGSFVYEFQLPSWFVATYIVTATADSGTTTSTFADSIAQGGSGSNFNGTMGVASSRLAISAPAVTAGDVLVAQIVGAKDFDGNDTVCAPAGWTLILANHFGTPSDRKIVQQTFYRVAPENALETTHTWTFKTNSTSCALGAGSNARTTGAAGGIIRYTGVDAVTSVDVPAAGSSGSSSDPCLAPSVTTVTNGARVLRFCAAFKASSASTGITIGPAGSLIYNVGSNNNSAERTAAAFDAAQATAGSTDTFVTTFSSSAEWAAQTVALRMAAVASDAPTVNSPICAGAVSVSGTSSEADGTTIEVFKNAASVGTTTVTGGTWTKFGLAALVAGDQIKARATATGETASPDSNTVTVVSCNTAPAAAANVAQFRSNGSTAIALGGFTNETTVVLKGDVSDPDASDSVQLQVEVKPVGTLFDGTGLVSGSAVTEPATASATVSSLANGGYHWRARAVDDDGALGLWTSFGGNAATDADFTVDTVKPTLTGSATSPPGGAAYTAGMWSEEDVQVAFVCADAGSGVATDTVPDVTLSSDGADQAVTSTGICADNAGNQADAATFSNIDIDQTAPVVSCDSPDGNWHASDVSIACTASDATSGLASSGDASFNLTTSVPAGTETANASTDSRVVSDNAGNSATAGPIAGNKVDKKDPVVSCMPPDQTVWYGANVNVPCTATDGGSGLDDSADASFTLSTNVADGVEDETAATGSRVVADDVGNDATAGPYTFKVDRKAPTVDCTVPDAAPWYGTNVDVTCTASDLGSGLVNAADASFTLSTAVVDGDEDATASTGSRTVTDGAGNDTTVGPITFKVDRRDPAVTCTVPDPSPWYGDNVSVSCTATDSGAGLADPSADASFSLSTSVPAGTETAAADTSSRTVADAVGNSDTVGPYTFMVDRKAPQLAGCDAPDGAWHAADVTLECTYTDGGSGPASQQVSLTTDVSAGTETDDATASAGGDQACDAVNNCAASPADIGGNKIDKKDPAISCTVPDQTIWYGSNVTVACTAADGGSGLADPADASFTLTTTVADGFHDATAATPSKTVADAVGNDDTVGPFTFKVDRKDPVVSCTVPDQSIWHGSNVNVACTATDGGGSGLADPADASFTLSTNVPAGTEDAAATTGSKTVADAVGNDDTVGPFTFKLDRKAPTFTCGTADGAWHANDVSIACTAADGGSGLANAGDASFSLSTSVPAGTETANASTGTRVVADAVGNGATAGPITGNKVDKKGPVVTLSCAATVILGSSASAGWTAADGGSGVKAGFAAGTIALDTSTIGPKTATVPASASEDNVDNPSAAASCNYSVVFNFQGFFQPVDNNGVYNVVNVGRAIPVKFSLGGNQGLDIFAAGYPKSTVVACNGSATTDVLEETITAGQSALHYDADVNPPVGQYNYVWKTEKSWASLCRRLDLKFVDGTTRSALFSFKK